MAKSLTNISQGGSNKQYLTPIINAQSNLQEAEHLNGVTSNAYENGGTSSTTAGFDSLKDNIMLALGDGR
jgi:hypothetical protein